MKQKLLLLLFALLPMVVLAEDKDPIFGEFGFKNEYSIASYQKYVGKTVKYLPCTPLSYSESYVFKTQKFVPEAEYVITDISPKSGTLLSYTMLTITFKEKNGKKKIKMKAYADWAYEYPFIFIDEFNSNASNSVGKTYSDPLVKGEYKVTDVKLELPKNGKRKTIQYYFENTTLNDTYISDKIDGIQSHVNFLKSGSYHSSLVKVEKPEDTTDRYGDIKSVEDKGVTKYSFEDELIDIIIFGNSEQFIFKLTNKSQSSIKVVWDDAVFVDTSGSSSKIMHSGIKYSQREASQPASTIIRGASLEDLACPTSNVRYSDILKEWVTDSMYPKYPSKEVKQVRLMLPIQIKDVVNEYVFIFDIKYDYKYPEKLNL